MPGDPDIPRLHRGQVAERVRAMRDVCVAVVGDVMLDRYFWGDVERISPEAPVPVVRVTRRSARAGGAANVAANLRALGARVELVGVVGDDREGDELRALVEGAGVGTDGIVVVPGRETTEKVRIIARSQQVVRADFEDDGALEPEAGRRLVEAATALCARCDAVVVSDYGKGVFDADRIGDVVRAARAADRPVLVDPHVEHFRWYRGASVVTPNAREATMATGLRFGRDLPEARDVAAVVREMELGALLVTRGEYGMSLYADGREMHVPTVAREVYDVTGAGDTVIGTLAAALAAGASLAEAMVLANAAAGEVVREVGTSAVRAEDLVAAFPEADGAR